MTTLRISKQLYEQEGKDLTDYIRATFKTVIDVTTRDDRGDRKYLISGFDCEEIDMWFSEDPDLEKGALPEKYKGKFAVWVETSRC